jgi:hypothetical protein
MVYNIFVEFICWLKNALKNIGTYGQVCMQSKVFYILNLFLKVFFSTFFVSVFWKFAIVSN